MNCEIDANFMFHDFINRRYVKYLNKSVLAPIWELVNHSPFTKSFQTSNKGVETAPNRDDRTTNELLHAYTLTKNPYIYFFHYGFASNEVFAYSFPTEANLSDGIIKIRNKGSQAGIESNKKSNLKNIVLKSYHYLLAWFLENYQLNFSIQLPKNMESVKASHPA